MIDPTPVVSARWPGRPLERNPIWFFILGASFVGCAVASFSYLATYPSLRRLAGGLVQFALLLFTMWAPFVFAVALRAPSQQWIAAAKVHASLYVAFVAVLSLKGRSLGSDFLTMLYFILVIELSLLLIAIEKAPSGARELERAPWLGIGLTVALLGGWACGSLFWSVIARL